MRQKRAVSPVVLVDLQPSYPVAALSVEGHVELVPRANT